MHGCCGVFPLSQTQTTADTQHNYVLYMWLSVKLTLFVLYIVFVVLCVLLCVCYLRARGGDRACPLQCWNNCVWMCSSNVFWIYTYSMYLDRRFETLMFMNSELKVRNLWLGRDACGCPFQRWNKQRRNSLQAILCCCVLSKPVSSGGTTCLTLLV